MQISIAIFLLISTTVPIFCQQGNGKTHPKPPPGFKKQQFVAVNESTTNSLAQKGEEGVSGLVGGKALKKVHIPLEPSEARKKIFGKLYPNATPEEVLKQTKDLERVKTLLVGQKEAAAKNKASGKTPTPKPIDPKLVEQMQMMSAEIKASKAKGSQRGDAPIRDITELNEDLAEYMFQADILLNGEQAEALLSQDEEGKSKNDTNSSSSILVRAKRGSLNFDNYPSKRWDKSQPIGYYFASDIDSMRASQIQKAIQLWSDNTCLSFVQSSSSAQKFYFQKGSSGGGCFSNGVGKTSGGQLGFINLDDGCTTVGIIAHEIGHQLAFFHTQMRYDRADYVNVYLANTNAPDQYAIQTQTTNNNYQVTYDYGSVMHYRYDSFAIGTNPVMVAIEPYNQNTMGQRMRPAFSDFLMMNRAYGCQDACPAGSSGTAQCKNGGFPSPKNCAKCICPAGFGGTLCGQRQASTANAQCTGRTLVANADEWLLLDASVSSPSSSYSLTNPYESCSWQIVPPVSDDGYEYWIDLWIEAVGVNDGSCYVGCPIASVEFKVGQKDRTGLRMCCQSDLGTDGYVQVTATDGLAVVNAYAAAGTKAFRVWYIAY